MAVPLIRTLSPTLARQLSESTVMTNRETYQCYICGFEDLPRDEDSMQLTDCEHTVHRPCWKEYLAFTVKNSQGKQPVCNRPKIEGAQWDAEAQDHVGGKCMSPFADSDIRALVDDDVFDQFLRIREQSTDLTIRTCEKCGTTQQGDAAQFKMICTELECAHVFCYEHGDACQVVRPDLPADWTFEQRCEAFNGDKANEKYIEKEIEKGNIKLCPHCNSPVAKNSGCNAMTCTSCDGGFCWLCGEKIVDSHGLPPHFNMLNPTSACAGKQFVTADGEALQGPQLTRCETYWAYVVLCTCVLVLGPIFAAYSLIFCLLMAVMGITYGCFAPLFHAMLGERCSETVNRENRGLRCVVQCMMCAMGVLVFLPPAIALSPCWLPFALYMRRRNQFWAQEQLLMAEADGGDTAGAVSLEESQARTMAAEQVAIHIQDHDDDEHQEETDDTISDTLDIDDPEQQLLPQSHELSILGV